MTEETTHSLDKNDRIQILVREFGNARDAIVETLDGRFSADYFAATIYRRLAARFARNVFSDLTQADCELLRACKPNVENWLNDGERAYVRTKTEEIGRDE